MKIKVNKHSATIKLTSAEEIHWFTGIVDCWMETMFEDAEEFEVDAMMEKLNTAFNGEE